MKILVVDDEELNCIILKDMLESLGHEVSISTSIDMANEDVQIINPDVIFLDVFFNGEPLGLSWSKKYAQRYPIIGLSAHRDRCIWKNALDLGMRDYLTKPVHIDSLKKVLQKLKKQKRTTPPELKRYRTLTNSLDHSIDDVYKTVANIHNFEIKNNVL